MTWKPHVTHAITDGVCESCLTVAREFAITLSCPYRSASAPMTPPDDLRALALKAERLASKYDDEPLPRVQIVNREHPHFEEYGRFTGKVITMKYGDKATMAEVKLEHCKHGTDGCFVSHGDVRRVAERG